MPCSGEAGTWVQVKDTLGGEAAGAKALGQARGTGEEAGGG